MQLSLAAQIEAAGLSGMSIKDAEPSSDIPGPAALSHSVRAAWTELFSLFTDTPMERPSEDLAWNLVNVFHRAAEKQQRRYDDLADEVRALIRERDDSEIGTANLEEKIDKARQVEQIVQAFEVMREEAAGLYHAETTNSWRPYRGGRAIQGMTAAIVDGRAFLREKAEAKRQRNMPEGTPVIFSGGRVTIGEADAKQFADDLFRTLDRVHDRVPDMVMVHGGDTNGIDRFAAGWAERKKVPQVVFGLDPRLGNRAGFKRNEQFLSLKPRYVIAYPGNGCLERLVTEARERRISVVDRRGPLGTVPAAQAA